MPLGSAPGSVTKGLEAVPVGADRRIGGEETCEIKQHLQEYKDMAPLVISILHYLIFIHALLNHVVPLRESSISRETKEQRKVKLEISKYFQIIL